MANRPSPGLLALTAEQAVPMQEAVQRVVSAKAKGREPAAKAANLGATANSAPDSARA